ASHTADEQACLRCTSVLMLLVIHVFVNVGMTVRLIPVIGLPLPLLSYGGSFTLTTFLCLGVLHATSTLPPADSEAAKSTDARDNEWSLGRLLRIRVQSKQ
ncbi:MAG: FtsW/RodA/SpoVE family cell cycle protein, partial [Victivallales bacterium]|nr:FtsW/RodA/SpoVE family cell cycle protein [Victivallales bacterium]